MGTRVVWSGCVLSWWLLSGFVAGACGDGGDDGDADVVQDAAEDGEADDTAHDGEDDAAGDEGGTPVCVRDEECGDGLFCNGVERCLPGDPGADAAGCVAAAAGPCLPTQTCDEAADRCWSACDVDPDADDDGHEALECGGDDCNDADPRAAPDREEVCDDEGLDEDCDPATVGERDLDADGFVDAACCNPDGAGGRRCGDDCNDARRSIHPGAIESCNGTDDNCNGTVDEGMRLPGWADEDRDLHGDPTRPVMGCPGAPGFSTVDDDCDDLSPFVHGSQVEVCDRRDNDCDGETDEQATAVPWYRDADGDGFGAAQGGVLVSCAPPAGYSLLALDCDDLDRRVSPLAREACNGRDDDCNGLADHELSPGDGEDDDGDGYPDARCPGGTDCNDRDATTHEAAAELCDDRDNDCDGTVDAGTVDADWLPDRDGDGFGDDGSPPVVSCVPVPGRVPRGGDCDDADAGVSPAGWDDCSGAAGVDDDCDGRTDEDLQAKAWYEDADGDGYGTGEPVLACGPAGTAAYPPGDCDDAEDQVHPGADEHCETGDGRDDDCDGRVDCDDADCFGATRCLRENTLEVVGGNGQSGTVLAVLPGAGEVRIVDGGGAPVAGNPVRVLAPEGAVATPTTGATDTGGRFRFRMRLGPVPGPQVFLVQADRAGSASVSATATEAVAGTMLPLVNADNAPGDGGVPGPATAARLREPRGMAVAADGTIYLSDAGGHAVYRRSPAGVLTLFAGGRGEGFSGDGGPAVAAQFSAPAGLALDETYGRLYVADRGNARVRVVDLRTGVIDTAAGGGTAAGPGFGDGGPATDASLGPVAAVGLGPGQALFLLSPSPNRIRRVDPVTGTITTFQTTTADCAAEAALVSLADFAWDGGELFVTGTVGGTAAGTGADCAGATPGVARRTTTGRLRPVAGRADGGTADGASAARTRFAALGGIAFDPARNLYLAETGANRVRKIDGVTGVVSTVAGTGAAGADGDHGSATAALLNGPTAVAFDAAGDLRVTDTGNASLRAVRGAAASVPTEVRLGTPTGSGQSGVVTAVLPEPLTATVTGPGGAPRAGALVRFEADGGGAVVPAAAATGADGVARVAARLGRSVGTQAYRARFLDLREHDVPGSPVSFTAAATAPATGTILPLVNADHLAGASGIPGPGTTARLYHPTGLAVASDGTVYFASNYHHAIYALDPSGYLTRIAGGNGDGFSGDDGPARDARLNSPWGIALDEARQWLYVADTGNWRVRRIHLGSGLITTVAGTGGGGIAPADGTPATSGCTGPVTSVAVAPSGDWVYNVVAPCGGRTPSCGASYHHEIRVVSAVTGLSWRIAVGCYTTWGGDDYWARFRTFDFLTYDSLGQLLFAGLFRTARDPYTGVWTNSSSSPTISRRDLDGNITRLAGVYTGSPADGSPAADTLFSSISGIDADDAGSIVLADPTGHRIRRVDGTTTLVSTLAGNPTTAGSAGDYGPAVDALLNTPYYVVRTPDGHLVVSDRAAHSIRLIW